MASFRWLADSLSFPISSLGTQLGAKLRFAAMRETEFTGHGRYELEIRNET